MESSIFTLFFVLVLLRLSTLTVSQDCSLPDGGAINTRLRSLLIAIGGEGSTLSTTLIEYHFTCLAVGGSRDLYRQVSVAVRYTKTTASGQFTAQFPLRCTSGNLNTVGELDQSPPANVFNINTRRDCFVCTTDNSQPGFTIDTAADCALCGNSCLMMGQGGCLTSSTNCCPFYNTDGSCTTSCPSGFAATSSSDFTCVCGLSCPLGKKPNSDCNGCVAAHVCETNDTCLNGGSCIIGSSSTDYTCSCISEYTGRNCERCGLSCPFGYEANSVCTGCIPAHVCFTNNPCQFGGTCETGSNNTDYKCLCTGNYTGINCTLKIEPCASNICQNGGSCSRVGGRDECSCLPIWTGPNCTVPNCAVPNCDQCSQSREGWCDVCDRGYTLDSTGQCGPTSEPGGIILTWHLVLIVISVVLLLLFFVIIVIVILVVVKKKRKNLSV